VFQDPPKISITQAIEGDFLNLKSQTPHNILDEQLFQTKRMRQPNLFISKSVNEERGSISQKITLYDLIKEKNLNFSHFRESVQMLLPFEEFLVIGVDDESLESLPSDFLEDT
jgi:hypothetical protein